MMNEINLKQMTDEDLSFILEIRNDYSTRNNLEDDTIFSLDECHDWFKNLKSPWFIIMVDGIKVGYFRTNDIEVGCDIHPEHRRKGYAKAAYAKYLKNRDRASLWVFDDNFAKNLYLNIGFVENGEFKTVRDRKYVKMIYEK